MKSERGRVKNDIYTYLKLWRMVIPGPHSFHPARGRNRGRHASPPRYSGNRRHETHVSVAREELEVLNTHSREDEQQTELW